MAYSASRTVKLFWADRDGKADPVYTNVLGTNAQMAATALYDGTVNAMWYNVGPLPNNLTVIDAASGISKFWFEVDEGDGSAVRTEDQDGAAFVLQDAVMLADSTCNNGTIARIDIAVSTRMRRSFCEP